MRGKNRIYNKEAIETAIKESFSIAEVCRKIGIKKPKGGSYQLIQCRIKEYGIDTSHFLGKKASSGSRNPIYKQAVSCSNERFSNPVSYRVSHNKLKSYLMRNGREYKCEIKECGINNWLGNTITLDIDHIDGDWSNCYKDNLRFICPNCHRQTTTFGGKNKLEG